MNTRAYTLSQRELVTDKGAVRAIVITGFILATALGAYVRIPLPFTPVPITLQTFFVILSGAVLGRRLGGLTQGFYVFLGVSGMPIFQGYGAGLAHLAGPTGGYLAGFVVASYIVGAFTRRENPGLLRILGAMTAGLAGLFACGLTWLVVGYKMSPAQALLLGFVPFVPGAVLKIAAAAWIYSKLRIRTDALVR
jgi:biotin transport system substrate-specific component